MDTKSEKIKFIRNLDVFRFIKDDKTFYDIGTMVSISKLHKSKIQRDLLKTSNKFIKYKNLFLYTEDTFAELLICLENMKKIKVIPKNNKIIKVKKIVKTKVLIPNIWYYREDKKIKFIDKPILNSKKVTKYLVEKYNL